MEPQTETQWDWTSALQMGPLMGRQLGWKWALLTARMTVTRSAQRSVKEWVLQWVLRWVTELVLPSALLLGAAWEWLLVETYKSHTCLGRKR